VEEVEEVVEVLEAAKTVSGGEKKRLLANLQEKGGRGSGHAAPARPPSRPPMHEPSTDDRSTRNI